MLASQHQAIVAIDYVPLLFAKIWRTSRSAVSLY